MSRRACIFLAAACLAAVVAGATPAAAQTFSKTTHSGLFHPLVADLNGDGRPDIAGTAAPGTVAGVLINNGSGGFAPLATFPAGGNVMSIGGGDLNGDGRFDLVVTINQADIGLSLLMGNGNGTFQAPVTLPNTAGADSPSVVVTDLNNDGRQDIAVAHNASCYVAPCRNALTMSVLMGNGDGTFAPSRDFEVGQGMNKIAVGDFNKDGIKDLVVSAGGARLYRLQGVGDGTFTQLETLTLVPAPNFVEGTDVDVADFNRDGNEDLVVALSTDGSKLAVLTGTGDGGFGTPLILQEALDVPQYVAVADYNGDGFLDLAYGFANGNSGLFAIRNGNGNGTFQAGRRYEVPPPQSSIGTVGMVTGQFNADTKPDLALAIGGAFPAHWVLLNTTGATPPPPPPALTAPALISPAQDGTPVQPVVFDWSDVGGAASYRIQIDDTSDFSSLVVNSTVTPSHFTAPMLVGGRRYWWRVRGIGASGTNGPFSSTRRFIPQGTTAPPPPPPPLPPPPPPPPPGGAAALTVSASGRSGERVTSSPSGINVAVPGSQSGSFNSGTSITLSVTNGRDAIWSGACSSSGSKRRTCTFTFGAAGSVSANVQ